MAFTKTWKSIEEKPTDANYGYEIDNYMRDLGYAVRERLAIEHNFFADEAGESNIGMHKIVTLLVQTTIAALADAGKIYTKDVNAKAELHFLDEDNNEIQITSAGKILVDSLDGVVKLVGNQTIAGVKTFGDDIVLTKANLTTTKHTTGSVTVTKGSVNVVGIGTEWNEDAKAGMAFQIGGIDYYKYYIIASVTDDTHLALTKAYEENDYVGHSHTIAETIDGKYVAKLANRYDTEFSAWASKSNNTVYQAETDGFVVALLYVVSGQGTILQGYTDAATPPTIARGWASGDYGRTGIVRSSFCMPVKKGDYWKTAITVGAGSVTIYWIPSGS